ncbi:hypothetical protein [Saccharococcus caldoxylosilyticus]|uniref:Uncharacterized protein n=1 Tax=Saccharococcus caldoxylosilyticus TaxID=81408 RepID=A0A150L4T9_9BACL|nr:hypothetical protein [Parageobacillus caldoxylosilyticus]KYD07304.1 hypothetical protein B4119_1216 [Parageobacillus caldoxylosilyticus]
MKSLQDALYNWLTIYVVAQARPDDMAAQETASFFYKILRHDFQITELQVNKDGAGEMYIVHYERNGEKQMARFPVELIDVMLEQIEKNPEKYRNYLS